MSSSIHSIYRHIFKLWRRERFEWFLKALRPQPSDVLLDVGGYPGSWTSYPQTVARIDTLNLHPVTWNPLEFPTHHIHAVVGNGSQMPFSDRSYDIVFSNSVIEHVGNWESQKQFASELRRVGKSLWVQTPAYECPVEPHYLALFVHWLPRWVQRAVVRWFTPWGWIQRPTKPEIDEMISTTRLLRKKEMRELFPDCDIVIERFFGVLPKSYIAIRRGDPSSKE